MDKWRVRATLMKEQSGRYYAKMELRSKASPTHISFTNVHLGRSQYEIEDTIRRAGGMLADHQNASYADYHDTGVISDEMVKAFHKMMAEIGEAGIEL